MSKAIPRPDVIPDGTKFCTKCRECHPVAAFYRDKRRDDGLAYWCKTCLNAEVEDYKRRHLRRRMDQMAYYQRRLRYGTNLLEVPVGAKPHGLKEALRKRAERNAA